MNPNPSSSPDIEAEAALWAARLEGGTLTDADQHALDTWLAASPAHRAALSAYRDLSADLELELPALIIAGRIAPPPAAPVQAPRLAPSLAPRMSRSAAANAANAPGERPCAATTPTRRSSCMAGTP